MTIRITFKPWYLSDGETGILMNIKTKEEIPPDLCEVEFMTYDELVINVFESLEIPYSVFYSIDEDMGKAHHLRVEANKKTYERTYREANDNTFCPEHPAVFVREMLKELDIDSEIVELPREHRYDLDGCPDLGHEDDQNTGH